MSDEAYWAAVGAQEASCIEELRRRMRSACSAPEDPAHVPFSGMIAWMPKETKTMHDDTKAKPWTTEEMRDQDAALRCTDGSRYLLDRWMATLAAKDAELVTARVAYWEERQARDRAERRIRELEDLRKTDRVALAAQLRRLADEHETWALARAADREEERTGQMSR